MVWSKTLLLLLISAYSCVAPGIERKKKSQEDEQFNIEGLPDDKAQDREYFRYILKVINILETDSAFQKRQENMGADAIREGKLTDDLMTSLSAETTEKLDQLKLDEIEHQKKLLEDNKLHMTQLHRNEWNPIHHDGAHQGHFTQEDLTRLLGRFNNIMDVVDARRKEKFKQYEMEKELKRQKLLKNKTDEERAEVEMGAKARRSKRHDRMHQPGHKAQMEETWEKVDGLDKEAFDTRTFFNLHDKNGDDYLDFYEVETIFLNDLDKVYAENNPDMDPKEREEEMQLMREVMMKEFDVDNDGLVSKKEFMAITTKTDFESDKEWEPLTGKEQFTEKELADFEATLGKEGSGS